VLCVSVPAIALLDTDVVGKRRPLSLFGDHMVLQRRVPVPIFGTAAAGEPVTVRFAGQLKTTSAGADRKWRVDLDPMEAGGPHVLEIEGQDETLTYIDVLVGEVWLTTGQSNMLRRRVRTKQQAPYPQIRCLTNHVWGEGIAGVPWNFALKLHEQLGVPVGIINRSDRGKATKSRGWVGTTVATDADPVVRDLAATWGDWGNSYNTLVLPVRPYAIRGVAWWHGEREMRTFGGPEEYGHVLPATIRSWRIDWERPDLPFVLVQVTTGGGLKLGEPPAPLPQDVDPKSKLLLAPPLRHAFIRALSEPRVALATSAEIDGGRHPKDHVAFAHRIAGAALVNEYGVGVTHSGPTYLSMSVEGDRIRLRFREGTANGLTAQGTATPQGFSVSSDGETWQWADAEIEGNEVVLWSDRVSNPAAARYGWGRDFDWANLFNDSGFATPTFTTDASPVDY
jgi:sialate O-acetylesterase